MELPLRLRGTADWSGQDRCHVPDLFGGGTDVRFDELFPLHLRGGITSADAMEVVRHRTFAVMIAVLAFTQLAFLTLGVATMLVMARSGGN